MSSILHDWLMDIPWQPRCLSQGSIWHDNDNHVIVIVIMDINGFSHSKIIEQMIKVKK